MKQAFVFIALFVLGLSNAGEVVQSGNITLYTLGDESYDGADRLSVVCSDVRADNDYVTANDEAGYETYMAGIRESFSTDLIFYCRATHVSGSPYFFLSDFVYVYDGIQYDLGYNEYAEIQGSAGVLRENAAVGVFIVLTNAARGEDVTLYYSDDSVGFTIEDLPSFSEAEPNDTGSSASTTDDATAASTPVTRELNLGLPPQTIYRRVKGVLLLRDETFTEDLNVIYADGLTIRFAESGNLTNVTFEGDNNTLREEIVSLFVIP